MPFLSKAQRKKFYALKNEGKMDQKTIDEWEQSTPEHIPERLHKKGEAMLNSSFWSGFDKRAAETYVSAEPAMETPGAPEKMLKWNEHGGVDPRTPEELQAAGAACLVTLPPSVPGAMCGTCMHFRPLTPKLGHGFCTNPEIKMDVTENMHCAHWGHPDVIDPVQAAEEEAQEEEVAQAQAAQEQQSAAQAAGAGQPPQAGAAAGQQPQAGAAAGQKPAMPQAAKGQGSGSPEQFAAAQDGQTLPGNIGEEPQDGSNGISSERNTPSPVGRKAGFPEGAQTSANPLVEQAVNDFQGQGATAGPTGGGSSEGTPAAKKTSPEKKSSGGEKKDAKSSSKESKGSSKGHTININVGKEGEKTASFDFWKGIVDIDSF